MKRAKFKDLQVGARFIFSSEEDFPFSGMARGPWEKISARRYIHTLHGAKRIVHEVGTITVEVIPQ